MKSVSHRFDSELANLTIQFLYSNHNQPPFHIYPDYSPTRKDLLRIANIVRLVFGLSPFLFVQYSPDTVVHADNAFVLGV